MALTSINIHSYVRVRCLVEQEYQLSRYRPWSLPGFKSLACISGVLFLLELTFFIVNEKKQRMTAKGAKIITGTLCTL